MNIIKKYWDSVYIYILLIVPGLCMCAGTYWTLCKLLGLYLHLEWIQIITFDCTQIIYLALSLFLIHQNKKDSSFISEHLTYIKGFIVFILFIQYNFILYLFPSTYVWECTFLFFACIVFLFDSKLMFLNLLTYFLSLLVAHLARPEAFLPLDNANLKEVIAYRILMFVLTAFCVMIITYFVERFLIQARVENEENIHLVEKQLKYYRDMDLLDTEIRKFRHDIKNHFICMESLLNNGKTEELQEYFEDLQQSISFEQKIYFSGNDIIDAILHHDLPNYARDEVQVSIYGNLPVIRTVSAIDLCTLFSNLLSNAITSANQCATTLTPQLIIHFLSGQAYFSIKMANSILAHPDFKKSKPSSRNHGYGMHQINRVLEKYNGRLEQHVEQQMMTITVYLPI